MILLELLFTGMQSSENLEQRNLQKITNSIKIEKKEIINKNYILKTWC